MSISRDAFTCSVSLAIHFTLSIQIMCVKSTKTNFLIKRRCPQSVYQFKANITVIISLPVQDVCATTGCSWVTDRTGQRVVVIFKRSVRVIRHKGIIVIAFLVKPCLNTKY